jgi:hypothetical protein
LATKARLNDQGQIVIEFATPTTSYVPLNVKTPDGKEVVTYVPQSLIVPQMRYFPKETVKAYTVDGKKFSSKKLADLLQKETLVLVSQNGKLPAPFFLQFFKKNIVVLVVPTNSPAPVTAPQTTPNILVPIPVPNQPVPSGLTEKY